MKNDIINHINILQKGRSIAVLSFSMFFGWLLSLPFEGNVLYSLAGQYPQMDTQNLMTNVILFHFIGLFTCGFYIKNSKTAKKMMLLSASICALGSIVFLFPYSILWKISLNIIALVSGPVVASWSFWFRSEVTKSERIHFAADVLIYSNLFMIAIEVIAVNLSSIIGLVFAILLLVVAIPVIAKLPIGIQETEKYKEKKENSVSAIKPFSILFIFVTIITINSGLMYAVIVPAFASHKFLTSWYWAVPYIVALYIMKKLPKEINRYNILTVAITMIGFAFVFFAVLDHSAPSYILINTLMLGACGVCDLFWWSILGEMLDFAKNPAKMFGIGISANVLGILLGRLISAGIESISLYSSFTTTHLALMVVLIIIILLPILYKQLNRVLKEHAFAVKIVEISQKQNEEKRKQGRHIDASAELLLPNEFTEREKEITIKLLQGKTYKMIAEELFVSENTIKFHIKNIYSKMEVHNKTELLKALSER
ncbi:MAG: helix-turn-helix transcriptional regulator [Eubacteriales bacterium]|nr:helix-turn-helix transcriptional regulator [Eubacteriales bacterium]MDD4582595.1 helix-turn-helix transcriptional regulator [Eubacteriales bacterium]